MSYPIVSHPPSCDMSTHTPLYRVRIRRSPDTTTFCTAFLNPIAPVFPLPPHQSQHAGPRVWGHLLRSLEAQVPHHRTRSESPPRQHEAAPGYPHCHIHSMPKLIPPSSLLLYPKNLELWNCPRSTPPNPHPPPGTVSETRCGGGGVVGQG